MGQIRHNIYGVTSPKKINNLCTEIVTCINHDLFFQYLSCSSIITILPLSTVRLEVFALNDRGTPHNFCENSHCPNRETKRDYVNTIQRVTRWSINNICNHIIRIKTEVTLQILLSSRLAKFNPVGDLGEESCRNFCRPTRYAHS
jgi:hypothetical protein